MRRFLQVGVLAASAAVLATAATAATVPVMIRGGRAILLRVDPGPLTIRLQKRDLNIYEGEDELHARLFDAQRREVATAHIPDDGQPGRGGGPFEPQSAEMEVECDAPGIYRLVLVGSSDMIYGFEASCERFMVQREAMLNQGGVATEVWFAPPQGAFKVTAQAIHEPGIQELPLLDAAGEPVHIFPFTEPGKDLVHEIPADAGARDGLWHFDVAKADIKVSMEGVASWTTSAAAFFDASKTQWMVVPWRMVRYLEAGEGAELVADLYNRTDRPAEFDLALTHDQPLQCELVEPPSPVALGPGKKQTLRVRVKPAAEAAEGTVLEGHVAAVARDDPEVAASFGFEVRVGESPVSRTLDVPIVLRRYGHENEQFGYAPDYVTNEVYFDPQNRPFIRERTESMYYSTAITLLEGGQWVSRPFLPALRGVFEGCSSGYGSGGFLGAKIAFDGEGGAYTLLRINTREKQSRTVLLYTPDDGRSYQVHDLPANGFDIEQFVGHNALDAPPPILRYIRTGDHPARFCGYYDLLLHVPAREDGKLVLGEPIKVSDNCFGSCQHSGGPASTATREGRTHIVWGEVAPDDAPGVPTYIATYDHATRTLGEKIFLAHAPPVNDVHNVPAICQDSEGTIHVVTGAHGEPFKYVRSLRPNDAYSGFTEPVEVLTAGCVTKDTDEDGRGRQTYISLVCGPDDALHLAYRQWRAGVDEHHPGGMYAALSVQSKPKGQPWGPARPVVVPPVPGYSIYYHKLTIDRIGRLFLSYNHWTSDTSYQDEFPGRYAHRAVLVSKDGGATWKLAETRDFVEGVRP